MTRRRAKWAPGLLVRCPCCGNEYESSDRVPFTPAEHDLHSSAQALLDGARDLYHRVRCLEPRRCGDSRLGEWECANCVAKRQAAAAIVKAEGRS